MLESGRYAVVARRHNELVLSEPKGFRRYVYRELQPDGKVNGQRVMKLLQCRCKSLLPVLQYQVDPQTQYVSIITDYYDLTLREVVQQHNRCDETELLNTLENILQLLKELNQQGLTYGILDKENIGFHEGQIKLLLGNSQTPQIAGQNEEQRDLRVLGSIMAELASRRPLLDNNLQELLQSMNSQYSQKLVSLVKCLCDPVASRRQNIWKLVNQPHQSPSIDAKKQIQNAGSNSPKNSNVLDMKTIPKRQAPSLLVQSNSQQAPSFDYNLEYFETKIQRIDDLVNECLKRSKRLIERSENRIK